MRPAAFSFAHRKEGTVPVRPALWLRVESIVILALSLWLYAEAYANWWLFALLILAPDLSFLGYWAGPRVGAWAYNALHTYTLPLLLGAYGAFGPPGAGALAAVGVALIWLAHIALDRALGYGLKYETGFKHTHLGKI